MIAGIGPSEIRQMTLAEFTASRHAFERFHGLTTDEAAPSDADYWRAVTDAAPRASIH